MDPFYQVEVLDCLTKVGVILNTPLTNKMDYVGVQFRKSVLSVS